MIAAVSPISPKQLAALRSTRRRGRDSFESDEVVQTWVIHHLQIIGEACRGITVEFRKTYPGVPWQKIVGMRNVLVHDYFGIDLPIVWAVVEREIPALKQEIGRILRDMPQAE